MTPRYAGVMDLTVCICTHDRPRYVRDCLEGLRRQTVGENHFVTLVVDSGSPEPGRSELRDLARQAGLHHESLVASHLTYGQDSAYSAFAVVAYLSGDG